MNNLTNRQREVFRALAAKFDKLGFASIITVANFKVPHSAKAKSTEHFLHIFLREGLIEGPDPRLAPRFTLTQSGRRLAQAQP